MACNNTLTVGDVTAAGASTAQLNHPHIEYIGYVPPAEARADLERDLEAQDRLSAGRERETAGASEVTGQGYEETLRQEVDHFNQHHSITPATIDVITTILACAVPIVIFAAFHDD